MKWSWFVICFRRAQSALWNEYVFWKSFQLRADISAISIDQTIMNIFVIYSDEVWKIELGSFVLSFDQNVEFLIDVVVQIGNDVWMSGWNRCAVMIEKTLNMIARYWPLFQSLCLVSSGIHDACERKMNLSTLTFVYVIKYLFTTMSSLFSKAFFMSSWHNKFPFYFLMWTLKNFLKKNQSRIRIEYQMTKSELEIITDINFIVRLWFFFVCYILQSIRNVSCYFPDDIHDHLSIQSSKFPDSIILMQDSIAKITIIQNYINGVDQTLN